MFDKVINKLNGKYDPEFPFSVEKASGQIYVSLEQKTASGERNFVQSKGKRQWFIQFFQFISFRYSCLLQ